MQKHKIYLALTIYSVLGRLDKGSFLSESSIRIKKMCQITCLLVWAGNLNFQLSIVILHIFLSPIELLSNPSATSNLFCLYSNLFDCIQYFLNVLKYFRPCLLKDANLLGKANNFID